MNQESLHIEGMLLPCLRVVVNLDTNTDYRVNMKTLRGKLQKAFENNGVDVRDGSIYVKTLNDLIISQDDKRNVMIGGACAAAVAFVSCGLVVRKRVQNAYHGLDPETRDFGDGL
jgi:hypothetical protein